MQQVMKMHKYVMAVTYLFQEIMSVIVVVLLLTLTLIAIFSAIDQLGISEMGRMARDLTHFIINSLQD